jgi:hypothetical protein
VKLQQLRACENRLVAAGQHPVPASVGMTKASVRAAPQSTLRAQSSGSGCFAQIVSGTYPIRWMVISGGWYWDFDDSSAASFYTWFQEFEDYSVYSALFALYIFTSPTTASAEAQAAVELAASLNATIFENKTADSIGTPGVPALWVSFSYQSASLGSMSVDDWYFSQGGTVYLLRIFTPLLDFTLNGDFYYLLKEVGIFFENNNLAKSVSSAGDRPFLYAYSAPGSSSIRLMGFPSDGPLYIYGLTGALLRTLPAGTRSWDGADDRGAPVAKGFYISNYRGPNHSCTLKFSR